MAFTKQELSVLYWLAKGMTDDEIIAKMKIKKGTLKSHKKSINSRLMGTGISLNKLKTLSPRLFEQLLGLEGE